MTFRHARSKLVVATGDANHRGRDSIFIEGQAQLLEAKLAYGLLDKDLVDELVRFERVLSDGTIVPIGEVLTTDDGPDCDGGRARHTIAVSDGLPRGWHRIRATVVGDGTQAEFHAVVVPEKHSIFVSDVDGTLTASEVAEFPALARGALPAAHPHAASVFHKLVNEGLVPVYLTARPEWLMGRTRAFLAEHGFPPGIVCTKRDKSGAYGAGSAAYKRAELERLASMLTIEWAFGNMPSDTLAYASVVADAARRIFFRQDDPTHGGRRIESYEELL